MDVILFLLFAFIAVVFNYSVMWVKRDVMSGRKR